MLDLRSPWKLPFRFASLLPAGSLSPVGRLDIPCWILVIEIVVAAPKNHNI
jgi:hypothetical protein